MLPELSRVKRPSLLLRSAHIPRKSVQHLLAMLRPGGVNLAVGSRDYPLQATSNSTSVPDIWILSTSQRSASLAAQLGLPYAFGYHIQGEGMKEAIDLYRSAFKPSAQCPEPKVVTSAIVVVGESATAAERLPFPSQGPERRDHPPARDTRRRRAPRRALRRSRRTQPAPRSKTTATPRVGVPLAIHRLARRSAWHSALGRRPRRRETLGISPAADPARNRPRSTRPVTHPY
jgi:alkanesulfonate monooxygenase SsuD/methylene tetrahydromethanopterin reductase-like flavin-dependent oxidoreductase (luciferase family)